MSEWMVRFEGASLAGVSRGTGSPLVFLHAGVADRRSWATCLTEMADTHRTVAYDRRGFGETTYESGDFSHLADLEAVLDGQRLRNAVLIGNSMGGGLALDMALTEADRCRALVLIGTAVSGAPSQDLDPKTDAIATEIEAAEEAGDLEEVNRLETRLWLDGPLGENGRVRGAARDLFLDMNGIALAAPSPGDERPRPPAYPRLEEIDIPVLVMVGSLDLPLMLRRSQEVARLLPRATYVEIADVAHLPAMERPDLVVPVLQEFLAGI